MCSAPGAAALDTGLLRADDRGGLDLRLRVIVDIAIKALSPAINNPATAVVAIDQLQRLLRMVGGRDLRNE